MLEVAVLETDVVGSVHFHGGGRTAHPSLVVKFVVAVGTTDLGLELVGFNHVHAGLKGGVALQTRT